MPIPNAILPNYTINPPAAPDPLAKYAEMVQLKNMLGQQQMIPLNLQEKQQQVQAQQLQNQSSTIENQVKQLGLKNAQSAADYYTHPEKYESDSSSSSTAPAANGGSVAPAANGAAGTAAAPAGNSFAENMFGLSSDDPLAKHINGLVRAGVNPMVGDNNAMSIGQGLLAFRTKVKQDIAAGQDVEAKGVAAFNKLIAPIAAEKDLTKRAAMLQDAAPELQAASAFDPQLHQVVMNLDVAHLPAIVNFTGALSEAADYTKSNADAALAQAKASLLDKTPEQYGASVDAAIDPKSYPALNARTKAQMQLAAQNIAVDPEGPQRVLAQASGEIADVEKDTNPQVLNARYQNELRTRLALTGGLTAPQEQGITALQKGADDYTKFLTQANSAKQNIEGAKNGDELAAALGPLSTALLVTTAAGVHRINTTEVNAAGGSVGSIGRRIDAALAKAGSGTLPADTLKEMGELVDAYTDAKYQGYLQGANYTANLRRLDPSTPVLDRGGNVVALGDAAKAKAPAAPTSGPTPATHSFSLGAWQKANPQGDVNAAKAAATAAGYKVMP